MQDKIGSLIASGGTIGVGLTTWFNILPVLLGCFASVAGITLSCVLIYCHIKKSRLDTRLIEKQIEKLDGE